MISRDIPFSRPFIMRLQGGLERVFCNVYDALDFLENEWPMRSGAFYHRAILACREALEGKRSGRSARTALLAACLEAGFEPVASLATPRAINIRAA